MGVMSNESKVTDQLMTDLRTKHVDAKGFRTLRTTMVDGELLEAVVKYPPPPAAYSMFREKAMESSAAEKASAPRILFNAMVVFPVGEELKAMVRDYPGIVDTWAGECAEITGLVKGTQQEKS